jgi:hypothetical protein
MSKENTGQEIIALHQLLTKADNKAREADTLCAGALSLIISSTTLIACSRFSTALDLGFELEAINNAGWLRAFLVMAAYGYGLNLAETWAVRILSHLRPYGVFPGLTTHPAHDIKHLYCKTARITELQASLQPMVSGISGFLTVLYLIGAFICFILPLLRYLMSELNQPAPEVIDPDAVQAATCFEQHCVHEFAAGCITSCEEILHYAVGGAFRYKLQDQSMIISYPPEQQTANYARSHHIMTRFRQIKGFAAVEWVLDLMQENRQEKQEISNQISTKVIRSYSIPTPKIQLTYAGIMFKLAPRVKQAPSSCDKFLDGLQAIWQNILLVWVWNYAVACKGVNRFKKRMKNVISTDCNLQAIDESTAKETTIFRVNRNVAGHIDIGYGKRLPVKIYFIELHRALMEYNFSTYHINGVLHVSYHDISEEDSLQLKERLQARLVRLHKQHQTCESITESLDEILSAATSHSGKPSWGYNIFNHSDSICLFYLNNISDVFYNDAIFETHLSVLTDFFDGSAKIIASREEDCLKIIYTPDDSWSTGDIKPLQARIREELTTYRHERKKILPATTHALFSKQAPLRGTRVKSRGSSTSLDCAPKPEQPITAEVCRSIDFGNGIEYYATEDDKDPATTCRAYPLEVDWLESGRVFAYIPEETLAQATDFTTRDRLFSILARGRTHGRKALNTSNSAQGIQVESQPCKDVFGNDHLESFGKIKTTHNIGIFGSMREVTINGERYNLVSFNGIPGLRH